MTVVSVVVVAVEATVSGAVVSVTLALEDETVVAVTVVSVVALVVDVEATVGGAVVSVTLVLDDDETVVGTLALDEDETLVGTFASFSNTSAKSVMTFVSLLMISVSGITEYQSCRP